GDRDVSTPLSGNGEILARDIASARLVTLPAPHLSNVECPRAFLAALFSFLGPPIGSADALQAGMSKRRAILGDEHVGNAIRRSTPFTDDFQSLITQYSWRTR